MKPLIAWSQRLLEADDPRELQAQVDSLLAELQILEPCAILSWEEDDDELLVISGSLLKEESGPFTSTSDRCAKSWSGVPFDAPPSLLITTWLPLLHMGEPFAALAIGGSAIAEDKREKLEELTSLLGPALFQTQLLESFEDLLALRDAQTSAMVRTAGLLAETELEPLLAKLTELALSVAEAEVGCTFILPGECRDPLLTVWGLEPIILEEFIPDGGASALDVVTREGRSITFSAPADPGYIEVAARRLQSLVGIPLAMGGKVLGGIFVANGEAKAESTEQLLSVVAQMASHAVQNSILAEAALETERMRTEMNVAAQMQRKLLPASMPEVDSFRASAYQKQCDQAGGDYYDVVLRKDGRVVFCVADATGHGIGAAMVVTSVRASMRAIIESDKPLDQIFGQLNQTVEQDLESDKFATLFFGRWDPARRRLEYVNAGHCGAPFRREHDHSVETLEATGIPLGMLPDMEYDVGVVEDVGAGDMIVITSDGVLEAEDPSGEQFSNDRLIELLRKHGQGGSEALTQEVVNAALEFADGIPPNDDVTVLSVEFR